MLDVSANFPPHFKMATGSDQFAIYTVFFIGVVVFSLLINSIFLRFSKTLGIREKQGSVIVRWSSESKPALGGIAFYIIFLLSFTGYSTFYADGDITDNSAFTGLLTATALAFIMGLADDAYNTRPVLKFSVQVLCGIILIASGSCIELFETAWINYLITVLWVVGMMNSINMLDNMDAITTVVSLGILAAALLYLYMHGATATVDFFVLLGVFASLTGFLFYNWHPSKLFMGDTGSQFLGIFLAFVGIRFFWNAEDIAGNLYPTKQFVIALIVFILPIADTTSVVINRLARGNSPFVGGKDHTTHHLSYLGLSDSQVALTFAGLSLVSVFISYVLIKFFADWHNIYFFLFALYALLIFVTLFVTTKMNKQKK